MPVRLADDASSLCRIGKHPDPLAWPTVGRTGRYDDPLHRVSVLYAAVERRTAFMETLDYLRPSVVSIAEGKHLGPGEPGDAMPVSGEIPERYFTRLIASFGLESGQQ